MMINFVCVACNCNNVSLFSCLSFSTGCGPQYESINDLGIKDVSRKDRARVMVRNKINKIDVSRRGSYSVTG